MSRTIAVAITLAAAFFACRSSGDDTGDDIQVDAPNGDVTIQEVQNDAMAPGTAVTLKGVVVTVIDKYGSKTGDFWVQEPGGGERSGVHVFGAPLASVSALAVGDLVDIAGAQKDEFAYAGSNGMGADDSGRSITELKPVNGGMMTVTKAGTGTVPAPMVVDALAIGQKATQAERDAEWEKWEGVLITVKNVSAVSGAECVGRACNDKSLNKIDLTGGIVLESSLAPLPGGSETTPGTVKRGDCLGSATGVVDYFFDYLLLNTAADSIVTGGTGCPVAEASHAICSDAIDNDGNGFADCADISCQRTDPVCSPMATVVAVQMGTATGSVTLQGVFVTARSSKGIWVADTLAGAQYNGVYVFTSTAPDPTFVVGAKVNVIGTVSEFDTGTTPVGDKLTEITIPVVTLIPGAPGVPTGTTVTAAQVNDITTGEPYEGVLVALSTLKVTNNNAGQGKMVLVDNAGASITTDDDIFTPATAPAVGTCFSTYTGVMSVQLIDNVRTLNARSAADMVVGTGCN